MKSATLKVGGATWGHFGRSPLFHGASNMCNKFFPNPSNQVLHYLHLVLRGNNPTQIGHHMWNILAPKFGSCIWATHENAPQNNKCQPNKKVLHAWSMRFLYVILAHMVMGTTLHQYIPFHPRRLPHGGSQTPVGYYVATHFGCMSAYYIIWFLSGLVL
jgi:hypothetical protein